MPTDHDSKNLSPLQVLLTVVIFGGVLVTVVSSTVAEPRAPGRPMSGFGILVTVAAAILLTWINRRGKSSPTRVQASVPTSVVKRPPNVHAEHPIILPPRPTISPAPDDAPHRLVPIGLVRDLMGPAPRTFDPSLRDYLHIDPPKWLADRPTDEMMDAYRHQQQIRRDGSVVWAVIVQANGNIWKPGPMDHGASVIWSDDPYYDERTDEMQEMAHDLFSLKGQDQADPESAAFSRMLTNEMMRGQRLAVPSRFTGGRKVFHSSLMIVRRHLPEGHLTRGIMPVWLDPVAGNVVLVPAAYWPPSLTHYWKNIEKAAVKS